MSDSKKVALMVPVGSSLEDGRQMFWALDTSCTRLFAVPENTRVDVLLDMLYDFLGKNTADNIDYKKTMLSKRAEKIMQYIEGRAEAAKAREEQL